MKICRSAYLLFALMLMVTATPVMAEDMARVTSQDEVIVKAIDVAGNYEITDDEILASVLTKVGEPLSTESLEIDLQKIFDLGYFSKDVKASLSEYDGGAKVTFNVEENPVINDIVFDDAKSIPAADLRDQMKSVVNKPLNSNTLRTDIETIEKYYSAKGYLAARVIDARMDENRTIHIVVSEGVIKAIKVAYFSKGDDESNPEGSPEQSQILDNGKTKPYVVTREMKTKPGDVYNTQKISKDLQRIYNLGFFEDVRTSIEAAEDPGEVVLVIEVEESQTGSYGFGAGYSNSTGFTGYLSVSDRNLRGKGRRADAKLEFGGSADSFEIGYFEPWFDKKQTSVETTLYNTVKENLDYGLGGVYSPDYEERRTGFTFTVGRPRTDYTKVFLGLKAERINVDPEEFDYLDGSSRSITGTIRTDTRDNVFNPGTGRLDSLSLELNGMFLGGDYDFEKMSFDLRRFRKVTKKQTIAVRMLMGYSWDDIPAFEYFDLGGVNSIRGYDEDEYSGTKMILYNAEYRFTLSGNLSAAIFADAGDAWGKGETLELSPMKYQKSIGAGIRLKIPQFGIGPVRLDYAYALSAEDTKIHFGFGHMF